MVTSTLRDDRGWSLGGSVAFVPVEANADFHVFLASPNATEWAAEVCTDRYSCRVGSDIFINDDNWANATPAWPLSVHEYRQMVINHEVGHWLGFGHADCPGEGRLAPVMQQQSIQVAPCRANPWPLPSERQALADGLGVPVGSPGSPGGDPVVVRAGAWYLRDSNTSGIADVTLRYGNATDIPVVGDWNGDGTDTPGVVRADGP